MLQQQTLELSDFSGGITDYPFKAPINKAEEIDNLVIDPNKRLVLRPGSEVYTDGMAQIPIGVLPLNDYRINNLVTVPQGDIFYAVSGDSIFYPNNLETAWVELLGISSVKAFNAGTGSSFSSFAEWNGHVFGVNDAFAKPIKFFKNNSGTPTVRTAGLPSLATDPTITPSAGAHSFIWYFTYVYEYSVGTVSFEDESAPRLVQKINAKTITAIDPAVITNIPVLANSGGTSYDVSVIKVRIYRTTENGNVPFYVGEVTNGTTSFNDTVTDASLQATGRLLYTAGGELEHDQPPLAKYIHINNGRAYYASTKEGSETFPNRVYQSLTDDPDSVPADFWIEVRDEIAGVSSFNDNPLVFGLSKIYRIDGFFDDLGRNGMAYEEISNVTGCVSHNSIVQTDIGVFFAGNSGFFWTDGFKVRKISDSINERYKELVSNSTERKRIYGKYDAVNLKIYWCVRRDDSSTDNDNIFCLDLRFIANEGSQQDASFTTWSNGSSFAPTAICIYKGNLIRADYRGYVFKHSDTFFSDPKIDVLRLPADWTSKAIVYNFKSVHFSFDLPQIRKWVSQLLITAKNISNLSIQCYSINDDSAVEDVLKEIRYRDTLTWGDPEPIWGTDIYRWNYFALIEQRRRFPAGGLRCSHKQIRITNAFTNITNSDSYSTCTVDRITKKVTLDNGALIWPDDVEDYELQLYPTGPTEASPSFPISIRNSNTEITLFDPTNILNTQYSSSLGYSFDNVKWIIRGIPKNESLNLMSVVIYYAPLTNTHNTYNGTLSETGDNA